MWKVGANARAAAPRPCPPARLTRRRVQGLADAELLAAGGGGASRPPRRAPGFTKRGSPARAAPATAAVSAAAAAAAASPQHPPPTELHAVVMVTSEVHPWSKTGGLGDVAGALPPTLAARGHRVMVIAPRFQNGSSLDRLYDVAFDTGVRAKVGCFGAAHEVAFFHHASQGVDWVFVDHPCYHRPGGPYGDQAGAFGDNMFRFTLLSHAACEVPLLLKLAMLTGPDAGVEAATSTYGENVVFLSNDWHAGLVAPLVAAKYRSHGVYKPARVVHCIHNLLHQGVEPLACYSALGMPPEWMGALRWVYPELQRAHPLDKGETVNLMKGAITCADRVMTVSSGYAAEIQTPAGGCGLDALLRSRAGKLDGVVNGIDLTEWNPEADPHLPVMYSIDDMSGKATCKAALQAELGLPVRGDVPLLGFIGRLDWQKGPELIRDAIGELMRQDIQLVMLGSGQWDLQQFMKTTEAQHRDKFRGWVGFSNGVSHRITAGADILLMPSRFEPCGLNQLYAMRYGTVPVVHATGGLKDTVSLYNDAADIDSPDVGTGFMFSPPFPDQMMGSINAATRLFREKPDRWAAMQRLGMRRDASWEAAAVRYEQIFTWCVGCWGGGEQRVLLFGFCSDPSFSLQGQNGPALRWLSVGSRARGHARPHCGKEGRGAAPRADSNCRLPAARLRLEAALHRPYD